MCGNGVRVFAHYLRVSGLESRDEFVVGSLAGPRPVVLHAVDATDRRRHRRDGQGQPARHRGGRSSAAGHSRGLAVDVGNPHLACVDPVTDQRRTGRPRRRRTGDVRPAQFPEGVNIEVLTAPVGRRGRDAGARARCRRDPFLRHRNRRGHGRRAGVRRRTTGTLRRADPRRRGHRRRSPTRPATCAGRRYWSPTASSRRNGGSAAQR